MIYKSIRQLADVVLPQLGEKVNRPCGNRGDWSTMKARDVRPWLP